jgi:hypothetical protein
MMNKFLHKPLKDETDMITMCPYTPSPAKQKNDIKHSIKIILANKINNIFPSFKPTYKRVLCLLKKNMVTLDGCSKTT